MVGGVGKVEKNEERWHGALGACKICSGGESPVTLTSQKSLARSEPPTKALGGHSLSPG